MKKMTLSATLVALLAAAAVAPAAAAQDRPVKVAVANVPRIFNELKETQDLEERFKQDRARLAGEEKPMVQQLEELQAEGRNYRPGSPQFEEWRQKFVKARVNHKAWAEVAKAEIDWKRKRQTREMYDKIYAAVSEYATSNQIDLVLADHQPTMSDKELEAIPGEQLVSILNQRRVIHASKSADISDAIIAALDARYKAGGGGAAGAGNVGGDAGQNVGTAGAALPGQDRGNPQPQRRPTNR